MKPDLPTVAALVWFVLFLPAAHAQQVSPAPTPLSQAGALNQQGVTAYKAGGYAKAADLFQKALSLKPDEILYVTNLAQTYQVAGQFAKGVALLTAEMPSFPDAESQKELKIALADTQYSWARSLEKTYAEAEAIQHYQAALEIDQTLRPGNSALDLSRIGSVYDDLSQYDKALGFYGQALTIRRQLGDKAGEAVTLNNIGLVYLELSQYDKALAFYQQALTIHRQIGDKADEATTVSNIGSVYLSRSQYAKALDFYGQALTIRRQIGNRASEATTLNNIGLVYLNLSQYAKARGFFQQALPIYRQIGDKAGEAVALNNIAAVYLKLSQNAKALGFFQQALPIYRQIGDKADEASVLSNIGVAYNRLGEYAKALGFYGQALTIRRQVGDRDGEATTLNNVGCVYQVLSQYAKALDFFEQALPIFQQIGDRADEATALGSLMVAWKGQQSPRLAIWYGKQAVNVLQSIRQDIQSLDQEAQKSYLTSNADTYRALADLLISQGRLPEAEQVLAMLKGQEVTDFVTRDAALAPEALLISFDTDEQIVAARYQKLADPVTKLGQQIEALRAKKGRTAEDNKSLVALQNQLDPAAKAFQTFLAASLPRELPQVKPDADRAAPAQTVGPLQKQLALMGPGTVAVFTLVEPDKLRLIVVTSQTQKAEAYPIKAADLRALALRWRAALQDPRLDPRPLGQKLSEVLLGPIEKDLIGAQAQTLLWSLDDVLRYLPLGALYDGQHYLVEKYRTSVFTGASLSGFGQAAADWGAASTPLLALGVTQAHSVPDPDGGAALSFPALRGVDAEIRGVARYTGNPGGALAGTPLEDGQFTQAALREALASGYPVVHVASHFALGATYKSSFLLLGDGTALTLDALFGQGGQIFQGVDLLTLSACQTAEAGGDGHEFESLAALAQAQGASSVLASLWPVSDDSTPLLMRAFYTQRAGRAGMTKAEALRQAQLSLLHGAAQTSPAGQADRAGRAVPDKNAPAGLPLFAPDPKAPYAHPYYWAPFVLIGNWR